jgi:ABC-type sugar transport system permease subunit
VSDAPAPAAAQSPEIDPTTAVEAPRPAWHTPVGLALVIPAFVLLIISYVAPTGWTVWSSFHRVNLLRIGSYGGFTTSSYAAMFDRRLAGDYGFAVSLAVVPLLVLLVIGPVLAWAAHVGGTVARWVTRGVLVLPLAAYAPVAVASAQLLDRRPAPDPTALPGVVRSLYWWGTFGLVAAVTVTLCLAALRRRDPQRSPWPALLVSAGVGVGALLALALQEFTTPFLVARGPSSADTPVSRVFDVSFRYGNLGRGAAVSTLLLAVLVALGAGVTVLIVHSGLRLEFDSGYRSADRSPGWPTSRVTGVAVGTVVLLGMLAVMFYGLGPLLGHVLGADAPGVPLHAARIQIELNTWLPPLVTTVVGVGAAALAAFGIGALRPLGRHSEWLLLPFGLFLFVGTGPLALHAFVSAGTAGKLDTFPALVPPTWLAIPALFLLTLLLRGQALRAQVARQEGRQLTLGRQVLPALPMVAAAFVVTWVVQAQELLWPSLATRSPMYDTGPLAVARAAADSAYTGDGVPFDVALSPVALVLLFLLGVVAQLLYLDRIALRVGPPERDTPPGT